MDGWIKLHRKILYSSMWEYDHTALIVFTQLLLRCRPDTGVWFGGRNRLAGYCFLPSSTVRDALYRLRDDRMIDIVPGGRFSSYRVINWGKYQGGDDRSADISPTSRRHSSKNKKDNLSYGPDDERLTNLLVSLIRKNYAFVKREPNDKDFEAMGRIHRLDGHSYETIEAVIRWSQQDDFWRQNIRSVGKLREKFETLLVKMGPDKRRVDDGWGE